MLRFAFWKFLDVGCISRHSVGTSGAGPVVVARTRVVYTGLGNTDEAGTSDTTTMNKTIFTLLSLLVLAGCNSKEREERRRKETLEKTFDATSFNYTPHVLADISFKDSALPFKIDDAASGGQTRPPRAPAIELDNGEKIRYSPENCCFMWSGALDKPGRLRVVWLVIHNYSYYQRESGESYDARTSKNNPPGGRWCQAVVDILPAAGTDRPDRLIFHFLPDGSVRAQLANRKTEKPLPSELVKQHSIGLPEGQLCRQDIENPWYGIPQRPHFE